MIIFIKHKFRRLTSDNKFSEVLTGSAWALSAQAIATCLALISSTIIARIFGAEVLGIVAVVNSFLILTTIITVLGTDTSILRLIPEHLAKYSLNSAFVTYRKTIYMVISVSLFTGILFFFSSDLIANRVFSKPHLSYYFTLASIFILFRSIMILNTQAIRGLRNIHLFSSMLILPHGANLFLLILFSSMLDTNDIPIYALLGSFAITAICGWIIIEHLFKKRLQSVGFVHNMPIRDILSISLPMLMTTTMAFVTGQTGIIVLAIFRTEAEVGYYSIAVKLATLTTFILSAINSVAAPKFSELFHSGKLDELFYVAKKSAKLIFWTTTPILIGLVVFGKPILSFFFGSGFVEAYPALLILVIGQFVHSISGSTGFFMNMTGKQKAYSNIMLIGALINIALNLYFTPRYGLLGAAFAATVSLCTWNISVLVYIKRKYGKTTGYFPFISN